MPINSGKNVPWVSSPPLSRALSWERTGSPNHQAVPNAPDSPQMTPPTRASDVDPRRASSSMSPGQTAGAILSVPQNPSLTAGLPQPAQPISAAKSSSSNSRDHVTDWAVPHHALVDANFSLGVASLQMEPPHKRKEVGFVFMQMMQKVHFLSTALDQTPNSSRKTDAKTKALFAAIVPFHAFAETVAQRCDDRATKDAFSSFTVAWRKTREMYLHDDDDEPQLPTT